MEDWTRSIYYIRCAIRATKSLSANLTNENVNCYIINNRFILSHLYVFVAVENILYILKMCKYKVRV